MAYKVYFRGKREPVWVNDSVGKEVQKVFMLPEDSIEKPDTITIKNSTYKLSAITGVENSEEERSAYENSKRHWILVNEARRPPVVWDKIFKTLADAEAEITFQGLSADWKIEEKTPFEDYTPPTAEEQAKIDELRKEISLRWPSLRNNAETYGEDIF